MKILCVCRRGNSRSAGFATLLRERCKVESLCCGIEAVTDDTWKMLYAWADKVIVMYEPLIAQIPQPHDKLLLCDVGHDVYWRGIDDRLKALCADFMEREMRGYEEGVFEGR